MGLSHARQGGNFVIVKTDPILRDDVAQELDSRGSDRVLFGESSDLWGRRRAGKTARVATKRMGELSDPIASSRDIWIKPRASVTRSITQTKQAETLAAPWGIRSHSLSSLGAQKTFRGIASGWMISRVKSPRKGQLPRNPRPPTGFQGPHRREGS